MSGFCLRLEGKKEEAKKQYRLAIRLDDRYPETHHNLALLYLNSGQVEDGIAELNRALAIDENFIFSYRILKKVYEKRGESEKAKIVTDRLNQIESELGT